MQRGEGSALTSSKRARSHKRIFNKGLVYGLIVLFLGFFSCSLYEWCSALVEPIIEYRPNALMLSVEPVFFGGVMLLLPICACLPTSSTIKHNCRVHASVVDSKKQARCDVLCSFLSGVLCTIIPFAIHSIFWNIFALPANPGEYESHKILFKGLYADWYRTHYALPMYISIAVGMSFSSGVLATIYLASSEVFENELAALAFPSCIYFLWLKIGNTSQLDTFPTPDTLFNDALTVEKIASTLLVYTILLSISFAVYYLRRIGGRTIGKEQVESN